MIRIMVHWVRAAVGVAALAAGVWMAGPGVAAAQDAAEAQALVDKARLTVDAFRADPNMRAMRDLVARARGVLVVPQLLKAGLIIGGEGGSGVLLARDEAGWSGPAFYSMAAGSIGLQIGAQASEVMLVFMTERAIDAVLHNKVKLGADASAAAGPVGAGIEAATTTNLRDDIYTYSRSKGLFAGASFEGAVLSAREKFNRAYYGGPVSPGQIVMQRTVDSSGADALRAALDALIAASGAVGG
jgi:lipid-binding SYLF domain-containing protein